MMREIFRECDKSSDAKNHRMNHTIKAGFLKGSAPGLDHFTNGRVFGSDNFVDLSPLLFHLVIIRPAGTRFIR